MDRSRLKDSLGFARVLLLAGFALFLLIIALLLAPSFMKPDTAVFAPTPVGVASSPAARASDTVTVDAGAENRWRFYDFERGAVVDPPDTAGWDLAFQRFHVIPSGAVANLGPVAFDSVRAVPNRGWVTTVFGKDTVNAATARWWRYSYVSHLLTPNGDVYALRTHEGHYAKFQIIGYYCAGPTPGCVTFRYGRLNG